MQKKKDILIALIGARGAGKSTVGSELAKIINFDFVDMDKELESTYKMSIADIFRVLGEKKFRDKELEISALLASRTNTVIATGGGIVETIPNNALLLRSTVVYLKAAPETLASRIKNDPFSDKMRPPLTNADSLLEEVKVILAKREPLYESASDIIIETDNQSPRDIAKKIGVKIE